MVNCTAARMTQKRARPVMMQCSYIVYLLYVCMSSGSRKKLVLSTRVLSKNTGFAHHKDHPCTGYVLLTRGMRPRAFGTIPATYFLAAEISPNYFVPRMFINTSVKCICVPMFMLDVYCTSRTQACLSLCEIVRKYVRSTTKYESQF